VGRGRKMFDGREGSDAPFLFFERRNKGFVLCEGRGRLESQKRRGEISWRPTRIRKEEFDHSARSLCGAFKSESAFRAQLLRLEKKR